MLYSHQFGWELRLTAGTELIQSHVCRSQTELIETQEQWDALEAIGCDFAQGYLIARPMAADQVADWIESMARAGKYWPPKAAD